MLSGIVWRGYWRLRRFSSYWAELEEHRTLSPEAARRDLGRRLLRQIQYFGSLANALPEWREAARTADQETIWQVWPTLPILTRQRLQKEFNPRELLDRFKIPGIVSSTGGSTGEPTPYLHDTGMLRAAAAARGYCRFKLGWKPGMPTIALWGSERDIGRQSSRRNKISGWLRKDCIVDGYSLGPETVEKFHQLLRRRHPAAVYGFTSILEFIARETLRQGVEPPRGWVNCAWNGGEMLYQGQVKLFEQAFGVPLRNLYGSREFSAMAFQAGTEASLSVLRPLVFLEIVNDRNEPAAPGESGRLIWTSTICKGTPFIRYECGDLGCYNANGADESGIREIAHLHGRTAGLLQLADGRVVNNLFWNHLFKDFSEVEQFQIASLKGQEFELRLKGRRTSVTQEQQLLRIVREFLGPKPIRIVWMERIPLTRQGKLEQVVRL